MKEIWLEIDSILDEGAKKELIIDGLELGVDVIAIEKEDLALSSKLGDIKRATYNDTSGDITIIGRGGEGDGTIPLPKGLNESVDLKSVREAKERGKEVSYYVLLKSKEHEKFSIEIGKFCDYLIVIGEDWKIVPAENIIAGLQGSNTKIIMGVDGVDDAKVAFETMERGVDGVLLHITGRDEIKDVIDMRASSGTLELRPVKVSLVENVSLGDRVCIDTCTMMREGEGMLVGSFSSGFFLVQAESKESEYAASRPFRVNAGAVYSYILGEEKTNYLSELCGGSDVMIVNSKGEMRRSAVGRAKIEKRPLILIEAKINEEKIQVILQNAETVNLVGADGKPISMAEIKEGDEVLAYLGKGGRHFGVSIDETIIER